MSGIIFAVWMAVVSSLMIGGIAGEAQGYLEAKAEVLEEGDVQDVIVQDGQAYVSADLLFGED